MLKSAMSRLSQKSKLIQRVSFYTRRLRAERPTKIVVASLASLALVLQLTAGVFPFAQTTSVQAAEVNNRDNIIYSGVKDKKELLAVYDRGADTLGHKDIKQIYTQFGITRADLANTTMGSFKTDDFNGKLKSVGRKDYNVSFRTPVKVEGTNTTVYAGAFTKDNHLSWTEKALIGKRSVDGAWFAISLNCGNPVYVVPPPKPRPAPKPAAACSNVTVQTISRTSFKINANASTSNGATIKGYRYVVTQGGSTVLDRTVSTTGKSSSITYNATKVGTYTVKVTVQTSAGNKMAADCQKSFTVKAAPVTPVETPKTIEVCELATKNMIKINKDDFDGSKHSTDDSDCREEPAPNRIEVCELATNNTITINESDFDSAKHSRDDSDCRVRPVANNIEVCDLSTKNTVTIKESDFDDSEHSKNLDDCKEAPVVTPAAPAAPTELPRTGTGEMVGSLFGLGSVIASIGYYAASRRTLLGAWLGR